MKERQCGGQEVDYTEVNMGSVVLRLPNLRVNDSLELKIKKEVDDNSEGNPESFMDKTTRIRLIKNTLLYISVGAALLGSIPDSTAKAEETIVIESELSRLSEAERYDILYPTYEYATKRNKIIKYKEELGGEGCQEINLDFCAGLLYAIDKAKVLNHPKFDLKEKTLFRDYITKEQVYEFGRTGEGLDVVYFKDEEGKSTKEPAICYVASPEVKKFKISDIEKAIDYWEKPAPGFLRAMVSNDVRVFFHGKASKNDNTQIFTYMAGIIYYNYQKKDVNDFLVGLKKRGLPLEMFGVKGEALKGEFGVGEVAVIKSLLARDCANYIAKKTGRKEFSDRVKSYQADLDRYLSETGLTLENISKLVDRIKKEELMTPFGAETWEEIDSVNK